MSTDFDVIVQKILDRTGMSHDELMERVRKKQEELSGFITPEGAVTIVGREFGISPERKEPEVRKLVISDLSPGMSNVDIVARVVRVYEPREFERRDGSPGHVANLILQDKTGQIRAVFWDQKASLAKEGKIQKGSVIRVRGAYLKRGIDGSPELNLGLRGSVDVNPDDERARDLPKPSEAKVKIADLDPELGDVDVIGRVVAITEPRKFERPDGTTGEVASIMLADTTGQTRVSLWNEKAEATQKIRRGDAVKLENAYVRPGWRNKPELHLSWRGRVLLGPSDPEVAELPEFEGRLLKLEEIEADMPTLDLAARVRLKFQPREFKRDDGRSGHVMNVILEDRTGTVRASFWDDMVEEGEKLPEGAVVLLRNARSRVGLGGQPEVRVGRRTEVEINPKGVDVEELRPSEIKLGELEPGIDALEAMGRVTDVSEPREFTRSDGSRGRVASLVIGDQTGSTRVSLWQEKADLVNQIKRGDVVKLTNCYSTTGLFGETEIHVGGQGDLEVNPQVPHELPPADVLAMAAAAPERLNIGAIEKEGERVQVCGTIVRAFHRRPLFDVCPNCGRSLGSVDSSLMCEECGKVVAPKHRVVLSFVVDDGTGNIRAVLFGKVGEKLLGMDAQKVFELFKQTPDLSELYKKFNFAGCEVVLVGTTRRDKYFDQLELRVTDVELPDPRQEARNLLEKIKA